MKNLRENRFLWLLLVAVAIWAQARPTQGVRHDAILYMAQVLARQWPQDFAPDIFFAYGSQDSFSLYSRLMLPLLQAGWIDMAPTLLLWLAHLGVLVGTYALLRQAPMSPLRAAAGMVSVAALPHIYGGRHLIAFGEEFLTARTLAEPLVLLALLWWTQQRPLWRVGLALLLAAAFHPLIALPGIAVVWIGLCLQQRRWLWLLAGLPLLFGLALAGIAPFDRLLQRYDDDWWAAVGTFNQMVMLQHWRLSDWLTVLFDLGLLAWGGWGLTWRLAPLLRAVVLTALAALSLSFVFGDLMRNVLVLSLQMWRSLWIVHLLALAVLPWLMLQAGLQGVRGRFVALALLLAVTGTGWSAGWAFLPWLGLALWLWRRPVPVSAGLLHGLVLVTVLALLGIGGWSGWLSWRQAQMSGQYEHLWPGDFIMQVPVLAWSAGMGLLWLLGRSHQAWRAAGMALAALLLVAGVRGWDQRNEWQRLLDGSMYREHPFQAFIAPQKQVYWDQLVQGPWFMLRRPSYFSINQGGGVLFNRQTAIEYQRRSELFAMLEVQRKTCIMFHGLNNASASSAAGDLDDCYPTEELLQELCTVETRLDYLVLSRDLGRHVLAEWRPPVRSGAPAAVYRLYACDSFRKDATHAP